MDGNRIHRGFASFDHYPAILPTFRRLRAFRAAKAEPILGAGASDCELVSGAVCRRCRHVIRRLWLQQVEALRRMARRRSRVIVA